MVINESDPVKTQETAEVSMSNDSSASAVPPSPSVEVHPAPNTRVEIQPWEGLPGLKSNPEVHGTVTSECFPSEMYQLEKGFVTDVGQTLGSTPLSNHQNSASSKFSLSKPVPERYMLPMQQPHQRGQVP